LIRISATPSDMGEPCSLRSNVEDENDVMVVLRLLDDVDYFVVMA
jgi:hypothetical protein